MDLIGLVALLVEGLAFAIFIRAIISWFPIDQSGPIVQGITSVTEPVLVPLRRVIPRIGMIDISAGRKVNVTMAEPRCREAMSRSTASKAEDSSTT